MSAGGEVVLAARVLLLGADGADRDVELEQVDLGQIGDQRLLWIDLGGGEEAERLARVLEPLGLPSRTLRYVVEPLGRPRLDAYGEAMHVEVPGLRPAGEGRHEAVFLNCVVGRNWLLTSHDGLVRFLEEFRERVRGGSELGSLDAPWLLATLLDWQVSSYQEEIAHLVTMIDDLDEVVLRGTEPTEVTLDRLVRHPGRGSVRQLAQPGLGEPDPPLPHRIAPGGADGPVGAVGGEFLRKTGLR